MANSPINNPLQTRYTEDGTDIGCCLVPRAFFIDNHSNILPNLRTTTLWAAGTNRDGQLATFGCTTATSPIQISAGGTNWRSLGINTGSTAFSGIKEDGTLWVWGSNAGRGTLGNGNGANFCCFSPIQTISQGNNWRQVSAQSQSMMAVKTDGTLWVWGYGNLGLLGTGVCFIQVSSPVQTIAGGNNWKCVVHSGSFAAALKTDGTLWTWGSQECFGSCRGSLGTNDNINRSSPGQTVAGGTDWDQIAVGRYHVAAIKTNGTLWTWGRNQYGQLGTNDIIDRSSPGQTISGGTDWARLARNNYTQSAGAIKTNGTLWMWGRNTLSTLGNGDTNNRSSPVQVFNGGNDWRCAFIGPFWGHGIKRDGTFWWWGQQGNCGQLGNGFTFGGSTPSCSANRRLVVDISTGYRSTHFIQDLGDI